MKYPWLAATIILIWFMATYTILERAEVSPEQVLGAALIASIILGIWGFRVPK